MHHHLKMTSEEHQVEEVNNEDTNEVFILYLAITDHLLQDEPNSMQHRATVPTYCNNFTCDNDHDWSTSSSAYLLILRSYHKTVSVSCRTDFTTTADPTCLQGKQLSTCNLVKQHVGSDHTTPLRVIVSGTASHTSYIAWDYSDKVLLCQVSPHSL